MTALVTEAYERFRRNVKGENSNVYPALERVLPDLFGICVAGVRGNIFAIGDTDYEFSIMSVSKPFVFALVCQVLGAEDLREKSAQTRPGCRSTRSLRSKGAQPVARIRW